MKLMQNEFPKFRKIEVELTQEKDIEKIPDRPSKCCYLFFKVLSISGEFNFSRALIEMAFN